MFALQQTPVPPFVFVLLLALPPLPAPVALLALIVVEILSAQLLFPLSFLDGLANFRDNFFFSVLFAELFCEYFV